MSAVTTAEPPPLPEGYACEPGTVPGWLNEDGLPTGCVGDMPDPGALDGPTPEPSFTSGPAPANPTPEPSFTSGPAPANPTPEPSPAATSETVVGVGGITELPETGLSEPTLLVALALGVAAGALGVALLRRSDRGKR